MNFRNYRKRGTHIITLDDVECMIIPLTRAYNAIVDIIDADLGEFNWHCGKSNSLAQPYAKRIVRVGKRSDNKKTTIWMHRIILQRIHGTLFIDNGLVADHKGGTLDNRRHNLRLATHRQNSMNRKSKGRNMKGTQKRGSRWIAQIDIGQGTKYIGIFDTEQEAHNAYCEAAYKYFGEFARTE